MMSIHPSDALCVPCKTCNPGSYLSHMQSLASAELNANWESFYAPDAYWCANLWIKLKHALHALHAFFMTTESKGERVDFLGG